MPCSVAVLLAALAGAASCADLRFEEQAERWGLTAPAKRVVWGDLDGDGWLDCILDCRRVYLSRPVEGAAGARSPAAASGAPRRFVDFTEESGLLAGGEGGEGARRVAYALLGDVDNDGDLDLFSAVSQEPERWRKDPDRPEEPLLDEAGDRVPARADDGQRSAIHLNDGTGRFTRLARSGVEEPAEAALAGTFLDYDLDGVLDIFAGSSYRSYGWSYDAYPDRLYRGRGDGTFEEVTEAAGLMTRREAGHRDSSRPTFGVTSGDWNGDGFADIFVCAYGRQWNLLWRNKGDGTFTEVGESAGFDGDEVRHGHYPPGISRAPEKPFRSNGNTFDCALADFDNDGDLDLVLGEITHAWAGSSSDASARLVNQGAAEGFHFRRARDAGITRRHEIERWNQGDLHTGWIDADGDGLLDLIIASGDYPDDQR
ncbi:MAG: FG-GAP repeat domain-containing protein, partial [Planctomycetota bacterium]